MVTEKTSPLVDAIHKFALFQLFSSAQASTSKTLLELSTHEISNLPKAPIAFQSGPETAWSNDQTVMSCLWVVQLTQHQSRFTIRRRWNSNNFSTDCQVRWNLSKLFLISDSDGGRSQFSCSVQSDRIWICGGIRTIGTSYEYLDTCYSTQEDEFEWNQVRVYGDDFFIDWNELNRKTFKCESHD